MKVHLVYAHPEPTSFNGALRDLAVSTLSERGHTVVQSDLYAMDFDPVPRRSDFQHVAEAQRFHLWTEQGHAAEHGCFSPMLAEEMAKLSSADLLLLQFPWWWFGIPAILKGWIDKVFAYGYAYGMGRMYEKGVFRGKRALVSLTTGGPPEVYSERGANGPIGVYLKAILHGMLQFVGMDVLPPFVAYAVPFASDEVRAQYLDEFRARLETVESTVPLPL